MMTGTMTIELHQLRFFSFHGLYAEEKKTGNEFEVDLRVTYSPQSGIITGIEDTVNYATLYEIVKGEMQKPRDLLETLVMEITGLIHSSFSQVKKVEIAVTKLHPPISEFTGTVGVRYQQEF